MDNQNPQFSTPPTEEIHLQDYLNVLYRRRLVFFIAFAAVVISVSLYTLLMKPVYEVSTTLHVRDEKVRGGGVLDDLGLSRQNPVETEIEILKSRTNAEDVVERLNLTWQVAEQSEGLDFRILEFASSAEIPAYSVEITGPETFLVRDSTKRVLGQGTSGKRMQQENLTLVLDGLKGKAGDGFKLTLLPFNDVVGALRDGVRASEVGKGTNIIRASYQSTDPVRARQVVNTLATVYLERSILLKTEEARKSVEFIEKQLEEVRTLLDSAEKSLEVYKREAGIVRLDSEAQSLIERLSLAEKERSAISLRRRQVDFALETLNTAIELEQGYAPSVLLDDPVVAALAQQLAALEVERRGLLVEVTEAHPLMQALQDQIREIQSKLLSIYQSTRQSLSVRIASLTADMDRYEAGLRKLPAAEQQLARLTRLATVNADIYTFLLQKHEEARIARASTISNISVIDSAITPDRPVKPQKKKNLLLGLIVGTMLGIGLAFFQEYLDDTIKDADTAKRILGLSILAVIPHIGPRPGKPEKIGEGEEQRPLISHFAPRSPAAEAFRSLRTSLHFSGVVGEKKVVLVTSSFPGEGKTTIAANLAETLAQTGARILLVGCDLRRPTLHAVFGASRTPGLTEILIGDATFEEAVHATGIHQLDFISAGTTPPNPAELLGSQRMVDLLQELRGRYDTIVLDAPPLLAVTDASILTSLSDRVAVVLEAGGVQIKAAQRLRELLDEAQAPVAGLILNDKTGKGMEYYASYRGRSGKYKYGYGYYSSGYSDEASEPVSSGWWQTVKGFFRFRR